LSCVRSESLQRSTSNRLDVQVSGTHHFKPPPFRRECSKQLARPASFEPGLNPWAVPCGDTGRVPSNTQDDVSCAITHFKTTPPTCKQSARVAVAHEVFRRDASSRSPRVPLRAGRGPRNPTSPRTKNSRDRSGSKFVGRLPEPTGQSRRTASGGHAGSRRALAILKERSRIPESG